MRTWDRPTGSQATFAMADCGFGYRTSRFKAEPDRYLIIAVTFQLPLATRSAPIRYAELARTLGVEVGDAGARGRRPGSGARAAAGKGMVLDEADHDTWSAGSFFINPILDAGRAARLPADAPRYATGDGRVKTSAAWLIEHAGFAKGTARPGRHPVDQARAGPHQPRRGHAPRTC